MISGLGRGIGDVDLAQEAEAEGQGLAGAGAGLDDQVAIGTLGPQDGDLDRRRLENLALGQGGDDLRRNAEIRKGSGGGVSIRHGRFFLFQGTDALPQDGIP